MDKPKVLVIDDEQDICEVTKNFLSRRNYTCFSAKNDVEALEIMEREKPDAVLLDVNLGATSGLDLLPKLLALHATSRVVVVSGSLDRSLVDEAKSKGAYEFLNKPFSSAFLAEFMAKLFTQV